MPVDLSSVLRRALEELEGQRIRIARQITAMKQAMQAVDGAMRDDSRLIRGAGRKRRRARMSVTARRALSARMKAYWAKRRDRQTKVRLSKTK
jgi:hypothetical protein